MLGPLRGLVIAYCWRVEAKHEIQVCLHDTGVGFDPLFFRPSDIGAIIAQEPRSSKIYFIPEATERVWNIVTWTTQRTSFT
jgi:hypothetical protein